MSDTAEEVTMTSNSRITIREVKRVAITEWYNNRSLRFKVVSSTFNLLFIWSISIVAAHYGLSNPDFGPTASSIIYGCALFGFLLGIAATASIARDTINPITTLGKEMVRVTEGARDIEITGIERQDEIGYLARALKAFAEWGFRLDEVQSEQQQAALENQRLQEARRKDLMFLAAEFESTIGEVAGSVAAASSQLNSTAGVLAEAAQETAEQTEQVSRSMELNSEGVTSVAATSDEFALSISEISRQVAHSAELAREVHNTAAGADSTMSALSASANEIGTIVELIQSIAQRTNLLALNASIEAARGGEAGRGFAVVASEVKELAAQTSRATQQVADQIHAIQKSTGESAQALHQITGKISQLEETTVSIASAVDQQSVAGQELARNIDMAARSTGDISAKLSRMRDAATASGAAANQTLGSANDLEKQASTLTARSNDFLAKVRKI